ncbi:MAG: hypothetical protein AMJ81_13575, partial [Phycisphaerae bacterium SM23_33]
TEPGPVTDVHWWGSLLDWHEPYLPELPDGFVFTIWSDVPAGVDQPFSHPGQVLWQHYCDNYTWQFAGWDFDPRDPMAAPEATFYFEQDIPRDNWFWQEPGENVYWISISARYDLAQPRYPFGWKTRPRDPASPARDDAVRIFDPTDPVPGMIYIAGQPIEWPVGRSWDMAFGLTTADVTPPTVVDVQVKGTTWLVPDYSIPVGSAAQVEPLGWSTINQIEVTFSEDVIVTQADLTLTGANVPVYNFAGFNYDPFNYIATWTLTGAIDTDKLLIDVSAATVQDYAGNALDGEWTDTVSVYPSGNGVAGGNFQFTFKVLPGNANTDNKVDGLDYNAWSLNYNQPATTYKQGDFNADAFTDGLDYNIWSLHYNQEISLPPEAEAAAGSSSLPSLPGRGRGRAQANFVEAMWRARRGAEHGVNSRKGANDSLDLLELPNLLALSAGILNLV